MLHTMAASSKMYCALPDMLHQDVLCSSRPNSHFMSSGSVEFPINVVSHVHLYSWILFAEYICLYALPSDTRSHLEERGHINVTSMHCWHWLCRWLGKSTLVGIRFGHLIDSNQSFSAPPHTVLRVLITRSAVTTTHHTDHSPLMHVIP